MLNQNDNFIMGCWRVHDWNYTSKELLNFIHQLVELGLTTFDHADIYGGYSCENLFGQALAHDPALRDKISLTSKCGIKLLSPQFPEHTRHVYDTSCAHIIASVERSLTNLATEYLDLLLIHRPDPLMNPEEVAIAFNSLQASGKVRAFGVSNFLPAQFELLQSYLDFPLQTNQIEVSVIQHEHFNNGNLDYLYSKRVRPQVWSPLGGGKLFVDSMPSSVRVQQVLHELAQKYACGIENIAIAWLLKHPAKLQILLGSGKIERVKSILCSQQIELSRDEWFGIWTAYIGHDIP